MNFVVHDCFKMSRIRKELLGPDGFQLAIIFLPLELQMPNYHPYNDRTLGVGACVGG